MKHFNPRLRLASRVKRWAVNHVIDEQSIAEHSFFVAHYAYSIVCKLGREDLGPLCVLRAIWHDVDETITGDAPGPIKRKFYNVDKQALSDEHYKIYGVESDFPPLPPIDKSLVEAAVKCGDYIDEMMYASVEVSKGNAVNGRAMFEKSAKQLVTWLSKLPTDEVWQSRLFLEVLGRCKEVQREGFAHEG